MDKSRVKVGKWIKFGCDNHIEQILKVEDNYILAGYHNLRGPSAMWDTIKLWKPKQGEKVLFWNDDEPDSWVIRKYDRKQHRVHLDMVNGMWDKVAPLKYAQEL